jgi:hypothetical protein
MKNETLLRKAGSLGYPLFEKEKEVDANAALAEVVESRDFRLWEGFPVMFATALEKGLFDFEMALGHLKSDREKTAFSKLVAFSCGLYAFTGADVPNLEKVEKSRYYLPKDVKKALLAFKEGLVLSVGGKELDAGRLRKAFERYFSQWQSAVDLASQKESFGLGYALSQVFSPKQKELFLKKLKGEKFSKTEREYYSRTVRKKALALANPELHRLALLCR